MNQFELDDVVDYIGKTHRLKGLSGTVVKTRSNYDNTNAQIYVVALGKAGAKWECFPHELRLVQRKPKAAASNTIIPKSDIRQDVTPPPEYTGKSVSYYKVRIEKPTNPDAAPYDAECNDIIEALNMNYAEGNAFKALWRKAAARTLGKAKKGNNALYDAEKVEFFGARLVIQEQGN